MSNCVITSFREVALRRCSVKKVFLEISQNLQETTYAKVSCNKVAGLIKKETLAQVFPCEFCEISKKTFFHRAPLVAASTFHVCFGFK